MRNSIIKFACGSICSCFVLSNIAVGMNEFDRVYRDKSRVMNTINPNSVHPDDLQSELWHRKFLELHPGRLRQYPNNGNLRTAESNIDRSDPKTQENLRFMFDVENLERKKFLSQQNSEDQQDLNDLDRDLDYQARRLERIEQLLKRMKEN